MADSFEGCVGRAESIVEEFVEMGEVDGFFVRDRGGTFELWITQGEEAEGR